MLVSESSLVTELSLNFWQSLTSSSEKAMAPHSSTLAWKTPWMEEPGRLQSMGSQRVGHDWAISLSLFTCMHWRRKWQPTPVFLLGESQGRGSLVGCRLGVTQSRTRLKWLSSSNLLPLVPDSAEWTGSSAQRVAVLLSCPYRLHTLAPLLLPMSCSQSGMPFLHLLCWGSSYTYLGTQIEWPLPFPPQIFKNPSPTSLPLAGIFYSIMLMQ